VADEGGQDEFSNERKRERFELSSIDFVSFGTQLQRGGKPSLKYIIAHIQIFKAITDLKSLFIANLNFQKIFFCDFLIQL